VDVSYGGDKDGDKHGLKENLKNRNVVWPNDGGCGSRDEDGYGDAVSLGQGSQSFLAAYDGARTGVSRK